MTVKIRLGPGTEVPTEKGCFEAAAAVAASCSTALCRSGRSPTSGWPPTRSSGERFEGWARPSTADFLPDEPAAFRSFPGSVSVWSSAVFWAEAASEEPRQPSSGDPKVWVTRTTQVQLWEDLNKNNRIVKPRDNINQLFLGSSWSTAVEHTSAEQNSWGRGFESHQVLGFLLFAIL